ncbi:MAG: hypothetical protein OHK0039_32860 [Bacteroidia bacterium]
MSDLFAKLNYKGQDPVAIFPVPDTVAAHVAGLAAQVDPDWRAGQTYAFVLLFVHQAAYIATFAAQLPDRLADDAVLWFAYPKKSSRRYQSDIHRDQGWQPLGDLGFEPVRQIAIDADWSALRFRQAQHIRQLTRADKRRISKRGEGGGFLRFWGLRFWGFGVLDWGLKRMGVLALVD